MRTLGYDDILRGAGAAFNTFPLSSGQERLWFLHRLDPTNAAYNMCGAFRCQGLLPLDGLQAGILALGHRHEALRTTFAAFEENAVQVVSPDPVATLIVRDVVAETIEIAIREEGRRPFDLAVAPVRFTCLRCGDEDHVLVVTLHHLVCDGASVAVLLRDLTAILHGRDLDLLPIQFADFALWDRERISGGADAEDLAWWRDATAGLPTSLDLPRDGQGTATATISPTVSDAIRNLASAETTTPFVVGLAIFASLLGEHLGRTDFIVGTPVIGRAAPEARDVVGLFANTIAIPVRLSRSYTIRAIVRQLRQTVAQALDRSAVPFDHVVDAVGAPRSGLEPPLVQALLAWQSIDDGGLAIPGVRVTPLPVDLGAPKFDLLLDVAPHRDRFDVRLEHATFTADAATAFLRDLTHRFGDDPDRLRSIEPVARSRTSSCEPPPLPEADALERLVADIWRSALGIEVGRRDNFFAVGGHSLLGARILTRLRAATGIDLPLRTLFDAPTIADLAARLRGAPLADGCDIPARATGAAGLSAGQAALWLHHRLAPTSVAYNIAGILRFDSPIDLAAMALALQRVVARQAVFRTSIRLIEGVPTQVVAENAAIAIDRHALGETTSDVLDAALRRAAERLSSEPFNLADGPLLRGALFDGGEAGQGLVLCTHHVAFDGSHAIFLRDLEQAYAAECGANPPPPLQRSYIDYALWQREQSDRETAHLRFWIDRLRDDREPLDLLGDRSRPAIRSGRGATANVPIDAEVAAGARALAASEDASMHMVTLAAWVVLLARLSGQQRFVVGCPTAQRPTGTEDLVGCFVNPVALPIDLSGEPTFVEVLARVRALLLDANEHAACPFQQVADALGPHRDLSRSALFDVMFVFGDSLVPPRFGGTPSRILDFVAPVARFDILWAIVQQPDGSIRSVIEYATDLYDEATIVRMATLFARILCAAITAPTTAMTALPLLDAKDRERILVDWNQTVRPVAEPLTLHARFEAAVDRDPKARAVSFRETTLSYDALDGRANQWAHLFLQHGIKAGETIGFWGDRCLESIEILLGILKAGAAFVPMAASWPPARVADVVRTLGMALIVVQPRFVPRLEGCVCPSLRHRLTTTVLDATDPASRPPTTRPPIAVDSGATAYVIFTSGSTGRPKGVVVRHARAVNLIDWVNRTFDINSADRLLFVTSYCFDLAVYDIFGVLAAGGSLRIAEADDIGDPHRLWSLLQRDGITFWDSAPAMLGQMIPLLATQPPATAAMLRLVFLSGDWIPLPLPDQMRRVFPRAEVVSLGGATEATIWSNVHRIGAIGPHWRSVPYGRPIQNAAYYILDARLEPCPVGVIGDLYIGGQVLADGYTDPALTAERFVPDPHAMAGGAIMYRTGDRASFWSDGTIEFFGRLDAQVKIQGHRIERGEIETILCEHAGIAACVVLARADNGGDRRLVAWYVAREGHAVSALDLRDHLASRLPDYMVPKAFVAIAAIPATENGKIDADKLPDARAVATRRPAGMTVPRDDAERRIAAIWCRVLGVDTVGTEDNFFDLGGHSAAIVRVQAALEEETGQTIPVVDLYRYSTVEMLAAHLTGASDTRDDGERIGPLHKRRDVARQNRARRGERRRGS